MGTCCSKLTNSKARYKSEEKQKMVDGEARRNSMLEMDTNIGNSFGGKVDRDFECVDSNTETTEYDPTKDDDDDVSSSLSGITLNSMAQTQPTTEQIPAETAKYPANKYVNPTIAALKHEAGVGKSNGTNPPDTPTPTPPPDKLISFNGKAPFSLTKRWSMLLEGASDAPPQGQSQPTAQKNKSRISPPESPTTTHISGSVEPAIRKEGGGSVLYKKLMMRNAEKVKSARSPQHTTPAEDNFMKMKSNSTGSMFVSSTINAPDIDELCRTMSLALFYLIQKHYKAGQYPHLDAKFDIFDETKYPLTKSKMLFKDLPSVLTIYKFVNSIFVAERLAAECLIMALAYIERIIALNPGMMLTPFNWRRATLGALILASKVWEEQAVWNADFLELFPAITVNDLNLLERHYLHLLQFNCTLNANVYAKYYFELRSLSEKESRQFPLQPLDSEGGSRLEQRSAARENKARNKLHRSQSVENMSKKNKPPHPKVLN